MCLRHDTSARDREVKNKHEYDSACIGSSALLAALFRNLEMEIAWWLEELSAVIFNDYHKMFDTADVPTLLREAVLMEFPRTKCE